jgi:nucleoid-associated protein
MPVLQFIAHQISRIDEKQPAKTRYREEALPKNDRLDQLLNELKTTFATRASKRFGVFNEDIGSTPITGLLKDYQSQKSSFPRLSIELTKHFIAQLECTPIIFTGHLVFIEEDCFEFTRLHIFHVYHQSGLVINSELEVEETEYTDTSRLGFSGHVNLTAWQQGESEKYLSIAPARGDVDLQDLFCKFMGFSDTVNITEDTQEILEIVTDYSASLPEKDAKECKTRVVEYCLEQDKVGEPVALDALSDQMDFEHESRFIDYVRQNQSKERDDFIPDRRILKKYLKFSGRSKSMSISFDSNALGADVIYDSNTRTLTLTNLPKSLLQQLEHALDDEN